MKVVIIIIYVFVKKVFLWYFSDSFVNSQEWTLSRSIVDLKLVGDVIQSIDSLLSFKLVLWGHATNSLLSFS